MSATDAFAAAAIAGLSRSSWQPPDGENAGPATLRALALAAQRRRLAVPQAAALPVPATAEALHADPRPILPPESRAALQRLLAQREFRAEHLAAALARLGRLRWRLHPFDLPPLRSALPACEAPLGEAERAYLDLAGDAQPAPVTADNWAQQPAVRKCRWFQLEREVDPDGARQVIEPLIASLPATLRRTLVTLINESLVAGDEPLLRRLLTDRSPEVRKSSLQGLQQLQGTPESATFVAEVAASCFRRSPGGELSLAAPASQPRWLDLCTVSLPEVASHLGTSLEAVIETCARYLPAAEAAAAGLAREGLFESLAQLVTRARLGLDPDLLARMAEVLHPRLKEARLRVLRLLFRPPTKAALLELHWPDIAEVAGGLLPADLAAAVPSWPGWPEMCADRDLSFEFAETVPRAAAEAILAALEPAPAIAERSRLFLRFLLTLPGDDP